MGLQGWGNAKARRQITYCAFFGLSTNSPAVKTKLPFNQVTILLASLVSTLRRNTRRVIVCTDRCERIFSIGRGLQWRLTAWTCRIIQATPIWRGEGQWRVSRHGILSHALADEAGQKLAQETPNAGGTRLGVSSDLCWSAIGKCRSERAERRAGCGRGCEFDGAGGFSDVERYISRH